MQHMTENLDDMKVMMMIMFLCVSLLSWALLPEINFMDGWMDMIIIVYPTKGITN